MLAWHRPEALPSGLTPVTRAAVADALAGRAGVLRAVRPDGTGPTRPDRVPLPGQSDPLTTPEPRPEPAANPHR